MKKGRLVTARSDRRRENARGAGTAAKLGAITEPVMNRDGPGRLSVGIPESGARASEQLEAAEHLADDLEIDERGFFARMIRIVGNDLDPRRMRGTQHL